MIQIITNNLNKFKEFDKSLFCISKLDEFQSLDNYEITIIDISDESLWYNKEHNTLSIDKRNDFQSLKTAINGSNKSNIIIVFPQNTYYHYLYSYSNSTLSYGYQITLKIKDIKYNYIAIITKYLINMEQTNINYGKTYTKIGSERYQSDFSFTYVNNDDVMLKAENGNDITLIKKNRIFITTLKLEEENKICNLLHYIFPSAFSDNTEIPEWINEIDFYTDKKCKDDLSKLDEKISILKQQKKDIELNMLENLKYKSILFETGNTLSKQINEMISKVFDYDMTQFKDIYEEDGLVKLDDITFIIETKGLNNEISGHNISDACNHLIIYEDKLDENNITENAKCLFFVAYERNKPLNERTAIKDRIKKIAKANNTLIIDTRVFLNIFEDFLNKKITKEEIKELFIENNGILLYTVK